MTIIIIYREKNQIMVKVTNVGRRSMNLNFGHGKSKSIAATVACLFVGVQWLSCDGVASALAAPMMSVGSKDGAVVAVIGTTGKLGRVVVEQLSQTPGISSIRCLLRHPLPKGREVRGNGSSDGTILNVSRKGDVAAYLNTLPNVEMIYGDIQNRTSLEVLLQDCDVCYAVHGPIQPKPFLRSVILPALFFNENTNKFHSKQVNYVGMQNLIHVISNKLKKSCKLVRITGKGETPWNVFSILINMLGGMAKAWNYESEMLLRSTTDKDTFDYCIIRPGIMKEIDDSTQEWTYTDLQLADNGGDLKVSAVTYPQIAGLVIAAGGAGMAKRTTITAMNDLDATTKHTVQDMKTDTRAYPTSMLQEHKRVVRTVSVTLSISILSILYSIISKSIGFLS